MLTTTSLIEFPLIRFRVAEMEAPHINHMAIFLVQNKKAARRQLFDIKRFSFSGSVLPVRFPGR
ncbi:MAG: hypothetical protein SOT57_01025, partial [Eubacteriales bacterium]|nr:hypothetical protein [Eubacteriales bacterium]